MDVSQIPLKINLFCCSFCYNFFSFVTFLKITQYSYKSSFQYQCSENVIKHKNGKEEAVENHKNYIYMSQIYDRKKQRNTQNERRQRIKELAENKVTFVS